MSTFVALHRHGAAEAGPETAPVAVPRPPGSGQYVLEVPARAEAPAAARHALTALNAAMGLLDAERLVDVQLLVSELVANAVRHGVPAAAPVVVTVRARPRVLRIKVSDAGHGFDPDGLRPPVPARGGGWGLSIVSALAARWGVDREPTTVWFEVDRLQAESA